MITKRTFLLFAILLLLLSLPLSAQEGRGVVGFIDRVLDRLSTSRLDTTYAVRHGSRFTVRPKTGVSFGRLDIGWRERESDRWHSYGILSMPVVKAGANVSYRTLTVGFQTNVGRLFGDGSERDIEYAVSAYGTKFGGDFFYNVSERTKITMAKDRPLVDRWLDCFRVERLQAGGYYVFNHRRFAYPAAFTQSYIQRRSCGSLIAGFSLDYKYVTLNPSGLPADIREQITLAMLPEYMRCGTVSLNFGYAYNWVASRHWLLHGSALPSVAVYKESELRLLEGGGEMQMNDLSFGGIVRTGVLWHNGRRFAGFTAVMYLNSLEVSPIQIYDMYVHTRLFCGIRF